MCVPLHPRRVRQLQRRHPVQKRTHEPQSRGVSCQQVEGEGARNHSTSHSPRTLTESTSSANGSSSPSALMMPQYPAPREAIWGEWWWWWCGRGESAPHLVATNSLSQRDTDCSWVNSCTISLSICFISCGKEGKRERALVRAFAHNDNIYAHMAWYTTRSMGYTPHD